MLQRRIEVALRDDLIDIRITGPYPHDVAPDFGIDEDQQLLEAFERQMAGEPPAES